VTVIGGDGGGDGGSFPETTGDCKHNADGLWASDMNAIKCKGVKWNAANGPRNADGGPMVEHNPVCWDNRKDYPAETSPWVVGGIPVNQEPDGLTALAGLYDCRRMCAQADDGRGGCYEEEWWKPGTVGYAKIEGQRCVFRDLPKLLTEFGPGMKKNKPGLAVPCG